MVELVQKRTLNGKVFLVGKNQKRYEFHVRPIHFESNGQLVDIDTTIVDTGTTLKTAATPYEVVIPKTLGATDSLFGFTVKNKTVGFVSSGLRWDTGDVIVQDASGTANESGSFSGALGVYGDIHVRPNAVGVQKLIEIKELPVTPNGAQYLEVGFEIVAPNGFEFWYEGEEKPTLDLFRAQLQSLNSQRVFLEERGQFSQARLLHKQKKELEDNLHDSLLVKWDKTTTVRFKGEWQVRSGVVKVYGRPVRAWNAENTINIDVELRVSGGKYYFVKLIPVDFLGVYPLFTDATTSYYAGSGDGRVRNNAGAVSWATARGAATGTFADATTGGDGLRMQTEFYSGTSYDIWRAFLPTDTSAIDDADTITAATLNIYTGADGVSKSDADTSSIYAVPTSQASSTTLATADFDALTYTDWGNITIASVAAGGYSTITLNATGIAGISKTGTTLIGIVEGRDFINSAPTGINRVSASASEKSGTSNDPYLSITTTTPFTSNKQLLLLGAGT